MTTTKVCCDGCGREVDDYLNVYTTEHKVSAIEGETLPPLSYQIRVCPDCWKKMKEALK